MSNTELPPEAIKGQLPLFPDRPADPVGSVTPVEMDVPVVVRDVFPAEVAVDGQMYRSARAVITRDRLLVYLTTAGPVVDTPYDRSLSVVAPLNAPRSRPSHLILTDGRPAHVNGQRGCGCGNPLKGWTPWQPYRKQGAA